MSRFRSFITGHGTGVTLVLLVAICLVLLGVTAQREASLPKRLGQSFLSLFQVVITGSFDWVSQTWNSVRELREARGELAAARAQLADYERLSREVVELRGELGRLQEQLEFTQTAPYKQIPAKIIAKDPGNLFSTIVIDKGKAHGVRENMPVVAYQRGIGGLVGKTVSVTAFTSTVIPLVDPGCNAAARLQKSRHDGLVSGKGTADGMLTMSHVSKQAKGQVDYGDPVITSGMGGLYPEGIQIGRVRGVSAPPYENSMELEVEPAVDFSRLEYVFVLDTQ